MDKGLGVVPHQEKQYRRCVIMINVINSIRLIISSPEDKVGFSMM